MSFYENLVMQTQMNYQQYYSVYASGRTPYALSEKKPLSYQEQISRLVHEIREADCILPPEAVTFIMKITPLSANILANSQRSIISKEPLTV